MENQNLSSVENGQLAKSRNFLFANLSKKMTATQNVLFSLALLHAKVDDDDYAYATFTKEDLEKFIKDKKFTKSRKDRILKDMEAVGTNSILLYDEKMMTDPKNGKLTGVLVFAQYSYDAGTYYFTFNTSRVLLGDQLATPILEILKRDEVNPIVYNLSTFANLTFSGQVLYEQILIATNDDKRSMFYTVPDLKNLFGATGKSMDRFNGLKNTHLIPAIESINKFADIGVVYDVVKQSRKITGVKVFWTFEKVNIPASKNQVKVGHELFAELSFLKIGDKELLKKLQQIENCVISEAIELIQKAIEIKKEYLEKIKKEKETEEDLQKAIKVKQAKEAEKNASQSQNSEPIEVPDFEEVEEAPVEEENEDLAIFFEKLGKVSKKTKEDITKVSQSFEADELAGLLEYAYSIYLAQGKTPAFLVKVLQTWQEDDIKTLVEAIEFQKVNYPSAQKQAKKPAKQAKKEPKTNIPHWSSMHPDNADKQENNILAPDFMEKLIETQIAMEIFDKPEGIAEREKRQKEIDEALAKRDELEAKKWELLGRPDTLEEKG